MPLQGPGRELPGRWPYALASAACPWESPSVPAFFVLVRAKERSKTDSALRVRVGADRAAGTRGGVGGSGAPKRNIKGGPPDQRSPFPWLPILPFHWFPIYVVFLCFGAAAPPLACRYYYNDALPERSILGAVLNTGMNSAKAETSSLLTLQERVIRLSRHTVVVILLARAVRDDRLVAAAHVQGLLLPQPVKRRGTAMHAHHRAKVCRESRSGTPERPPTYRMEPARVTPRGPPPTHFAPPVCLRNYLNTTPISNCGSAGGAIQGIPECPLVLRLNAYHVSKRNPTAISPICSDRSPPTGTTSLNPRRSRRLAAK